jgi:hypothetical protein
MPGVKVIFQPNMRMTVSGNNGALSAIGKADSLIVFTAQDSLNGWEGIMISNNNVLNKLDYAEVSYGGNRDAVSGVAPANVGLEGFASGKMSITNTNIYHSFGDGIFAEDGASLEAFSDNDMSNNNDYPLSLAVDNVAIIAATNSYTDNGDNMVRILESTLNLADEQTWPALADGVSYYLPEDISINSGLVISAGASFMAAANTYLTIETEGYLEAIGTETDSITFDAEDINNGWRGIYYFSSNNRNVLDYVRVSNAGNNTGARSGVQPSAIGLEGFYQAVLSMSNSTVSNSVGDYGMFVEGNATLREFADNTFTNNAEFPLRVEIKHLGAFNNTSVFSGNGTDAVEVAASNLTEDITMAFLEDGTPYFFSGKVSLNAELIIEAGTSLQFDEDVVFEVDTEGSLIAVGTADNMITFTAQDTNAPWGGIFFYSTDASNELTYCEVSYGGNRSAISGVEPANVGLEGFYDAELKMTNCSITNSSGYGVFVEGQATLKNADNDPITTQAELEAAGNTFSANGISPSNL